VDQCPGDEAANATLPNLCSGYHTCGLVFFFVTSVARMLIHPMCIDFFAVKPFAIRSNVAELVEFGAAPVLARQTF
jgi:hypothetical protein